MKKNVEEIRGKDELHLLANAFIELNDYSRALKAYEYLNVIEPYNGNTLSNIAQINHILGDTKKAKTERIHKRVGRLLSSCQYETSFT